MSRVARWNIEKTKVKVVFRLQFHATHIPQTGWDKLYISFIPADAGNATAKTTKANVRNGTCKWGDPIYETTRLLQDIKTKQYDEKLYKLVVAMGSSRSSILGEATINLADYADASNPSAVALPLHGCDSGAMLHVAVQLLTSKTGFREFEQQRELREKGLQAGTSPISPDQQSSIGHLTKEIAYSQVNKVNARVRFREKSKEHHLLEEDISLNEEYADSAVGFDGSSNTSESLNAEKHDTSGTHEIDSLRSTVSGDLAGLSQSPQQEKQDPSDSHFLTQGASDWVHVWSSDYSADNDLASTYEENSRLRGYLETTESSVHELKVEVCSLQNHAEEISAETHKFNQQLSAEITSEEQLAKEVSVLKSECSKLKDELQRLTGDKSVLPLPSKEAIKKDQNHFKDLEVIWSKGLLVMEDRMRELYNKVRLSHHERDLRFLHSDLEALLDILQDIKLETGKAISDLNVVTTDRSNAKETREMSLHESDRYVLGTGTDPELFQPDISMLTSVGVTGPVSQRSDSVDAAATMKEKIFELLRELDESNAERESLTKKMDQMECYYEALVQELEENQRQMLGELQSLRNEHSTCLYRFQSTKAEMETMHREMNEQILRFAGDKQDLESVNKELERRTVTAEAALRRARLNYSIAVEQLQKDLEVLSFQVLSMYETHENLIKQAVIDSSPSFQGYSEMMQNSEKTESGEFHSTKLFKCQNQYVEMKKQHSGDIFSEDSKRSLQLQEDIYQKVEEEVCEMHYLNLYLDLFSNTLKETVLEASSGVGFMKKRIDELTWQQELLAESKELLIEKLQAAMDDVHSLNEDKAICIAKCKDMAVQKQNLEANLEDVTSENRSMRQKINDLEALIMEYKDYKSKYNACAVEKTELANLLKEEALENVHLQNDVSSLQEELKRMKTEFDDLIVVKKDLQNTLDFLQNRIRNLLSSYDKSFDGLSLWRESVGQHLESNDVPGILMQLEEMQTAAFKMILQLSKEKKHLMDQRDEAYVSLSVVESNKLVMKQAFENDIKDMASKLDVYNVLSQKLQSEIEAVSDKLKVNSEVEENHARQQKELSSDLERLEVEVQELTSKNREVTQEILVLESVNQELESSKLTISELEEKNKILTQSLQDKIEESSKHSFELNCLNESFQHLQGELLAERSSKDKLESLLSDLTSQMNEKHCQLMHFDQQKSEVVHLRQMVSELQSEKLRVCHLLLQSEECLKNVHEESSSITLLEAQLSEMLELSVTADVSLIFIQTQYEAWTEDLVQQLSLSKSDLAELQNKHFHVESILNGCFAHETHYTGENTKLLTSLFSLKSELDTAVVENQKLLNANSKITAELEKYKSRVEEMELNHCEEQGQRHLKIERVEHLLVGSQEEINDMLLLNEELEVKLLVLKSKLDEEHKKVGLLEGYGDEVMFLQYQCDELSQRLSEQIMKTEEFKNLSTHLKELEDKAEEECAQAQEKRESEGPPTAMQESLRIVFIKEKYETRLQEIKQQLAVSKKHSEEILWKLQDAINEIENRKKSEASHLKKNEELGLKILELEAELKAVTSDKREKVKAYDRMKAELECSMISLECCKDEKQKLEVSLKQCIEEKSKLADEINMAKQLLEASTSSTTCSKRVPCLKHLERECSIKLEEAESTSSVVVGEGEFSGALTNLQPEDLLSNDGNGIQNLALMNQENFLNNDAKDLGVFSDQFRAQSLRSSMDHLNNELERVKNENMLLSQEDHQFDLKFPDLRRELVLLCKVNEELGAIYPLFNKYSRTGNALERVLALEIELAEALQNKRKTSINFQSSFLKQHNDEEAIFKSFRDINELIEDMLELKGRYSSVETELKEMHGRYSQLSLKYAEVEGERQKVMMTLKGVRAASARKSQRLIRSSSARLDDQS